MIVGINYNGFRDANSQDISKAWCKLGNRGSINQSSHFIPIYDDYHNEFSPKFMMVKWYLVVEYHLQLSYIERRGRKHRELEAFYGWSNYHQFVKLKMGVTQVIRFELIRETTNRIIIFKISWKQREIGKGFMPTFKGNHCHWKEVTRHF